MTERELAAEHTQTNGMNGRIYKTNRMNTCAAAMCFGDGGDGDGGVETLLGYTTVGFVDEHYTFTNARVVCVYVVCVLYARAVCVCLPVIV